MRAEKARTSFQQKLPIQKEKQLLGAKKKREFSQQKKGSQKR